MGVGRYVFHHPALGPSKKPSQRGRPCGPHLSLFFPAKGPRKPLVIVGSNGSFERLTGIFVRSCGQDVLEVRGPGI